MNERPNFKPYEGTNLENPRYTEYRIIDNIAKQEWEKLLGFKLNSNTVKVTNSFWINHVYEICCIQIGAAMRRGWKP